MAVCKMCQHVLMFTGVKHRHGFFQAIQFGHSTNVMAAEFAAKLRARRLILTHLSGRYRAEPTDHDHARSASPQQVGLQHLLREAQQVRRAATSMAAFHPMLACRTRLTCPAQFSFALAPTLQTQQAAPTVEIAMAEDFRTFSIKGSWEPMHCG